MMENNENNVNVEQTQNTQPMQNAQTGFVQQQNTVNQVNQVQPTQMEEQEEKPKRSKKLLLLLFGMIGTGIILGTSTFAWFTANKTVSVNDISVNVAAQNGIQISVDGTSWKSIVQTSDLIGATSTYSAAVNQIPSTSSSLAPVSTIGATDSTGKMEMYLGDVIGQDDANSDNYGEYILTTTKETDTHGTTGSYIAFDLFFKVEQSTPIWITANSGVTTSDVAHTGIKNATRIAFVIEGNAVNGTALNTIQALNGGTSAPVYIWEPNYDVHSATGVTNASETYGLTTQQTGATRLAYSGVKDEIDDTDDVALKVPAGTTHATAYSSFFSAVTPTYTTVEGFTEAIDGWTFSAGITKVRVYMWVEGQDVDCENSASGGNVTYKLQITSEDPDATP